MGGVILSGPTIAPRSTGRTDGETMTAGERGTRARNEVSLCQSCGIVMRRSAELGTDRGGRTVRNYCCDCFRDGEFTEPNLTMEELVARAVHGRWMREVDELAFKSAVRGLLANLERWRKADQLPVASLS